MKNLITAALIAMFSTSAFADQSQQHQQMMQQQHQQQQYMMQQQHPQYDSRAHHGEGINRDSHSKKQL